MSTSKPTRNKSPLVGLFILLILLLVIGALLFLTSSRDLPSEDSVNLSSNSMDIISSNEIISSSVKLSSSSSINLSSSRKSILKVKKQLPKLQPKFISSIAKVSSSSQVSKKIEFQKYCINSKRIPKTPKDAFNCSKELWTVGKVLSDKQKALTLLKKARKWYDNGSIVYEIARIYATKKIMDTKIVTLSDIVYSKNDAWDYRDRKKAVKLKIEALSRIQELYPSRSNKKKLIKAEILYSKM